jgi:polyhydroxyalkanoate synthesis regulator phasin
MAEHEQSPGSERQHSPGSEHQHAPSSERLREAVRDGFTIMLGAASWAFEQGDHLIDTWLHQGEVSREEGRRRFDEFASNTRRRGEDLGRRVSNSMRSSMPVATRDQVAQLERQVAELTRQIEAMKAGGSTQSPSGTTAPR